MDIIGRVTELPIPHRGASLAPSLDFNTCIVLDESENFWVLD
jgi:hypothetical protein